MMTQRTFSKICLEFHPPGQRRPMLLLRKFKSLRWRIFFKSLKLALALCSYGFILIITWWVFGETKISGHTCWDPIGDLGVEIRHLSFLKFSRACLGFPGGASGKEPACQCRQHKRCEFDPWVRKALWRRPWQSTPRGPRSLAGCSPRGHRVRQDQATKQQEQQTGDYDH